MTKLVLFDLDGTILSGTSSGTALGFKLLFSGKIGWWQCLATILFIPRFLARYGFEVFIKDKAYLSGLTESEVIEFAEPFIKEQVFSQIRSTLVARVKEHLENGDTVVLLTGTHQMIADRVAEHLGMHHAEGAKYQLRDGRFTSEPPLQHPFRREKLTVAKRLCEQYNMSLADCVAYGNSINDRFLLSAVGKAVAVAPDRRLRRLAMKKGWEIIE